MKNLGIHKENGSIMMEYVLLNLMLIGLLMASGFLFIKPDQGNEYQADYSIKPDGEIVYTPSSSVDYGLLGHTFIKRYQMMRDIVSMPYP